MERAQEILAEFATEKNIINREFVIGKSRCSMLFNPDLTDAEILRSVVVASQQLSGAKLTAASVLERVLYASETETAVEKEEAIERLLAGDAILIIEGVPEYLVINARKYEKRAIMEPPTETVLRGPREGFIEDLKTNLSLLQRKIKSPALAIEKFTIGRVSSTGVAMVYISTVADPKLINKLRSKLKKIDIDCLNDSHYLRPFLEEHPYSMFNQSGVTEKPDVVAAKMLEGRVAFVVDGSPMVVTLPFVLIEDFQSSEDYYERSTFSSFLRILRFIAVLIAVLLPGLYVAVQVYHYSIIPMKFLVTLMNAIKGIPLEPMAEVLFVILLFEIIRESSVRMPRAVGMAMSIVGALVLGDTAVKAGMISSPAVMIIALSSIALYTVPEQVGPLTILRVLFTVVGGLAGLYGIILGSLFLIHYLAGLDSYGAPYLAPLAPLVPSDLKDALIRKPLIEMKDRPRSIPNINKTRLG